jgi:hypothetical protein
MKPYDGLESEHLDNVCVLRPVSEAGNFAI